MFFLFSYIFFVVNRQCTYIYCIIDFLYCSNWNPMFILSCFFIFVHVIWPHVAHFHVSECTNKILLLTSGRITECDKPLITDDDMFLTRQLLDSYTNYNFISIVFQMCKKIKIMYLILFPKCNIAYHFNCLIEFL